MVNLFPDIYKARNFILLKVLGILILTRDESFINASDDKWFAYSNQQSRPDVLIHLVNRFYLRLIKFENHFVRVTLTIEMHLTCLYSPTSIGDKKEKVNSIYSFANEILVRYQNSVYYHSQ